MGRVAHLRGKLALTAAMLAYVGLVYLLPFTCPILYITGIHCPGCGLTRAWLAALQGALGRAFVYHPMFWSVPLLYLFFWKDGRVFAQPRYNRLALTAIGLGFLAVWLGRLWGGVAFC